MSGTRLSQWCVYLRPNEPPIDHFRQRRQAEECAARLALRDASSFVWDRHFARMVVRFERAPTGRVVVTAGAAEFPIVQPPDEAL